MGLDTERFLKAGYPALDSGVMAHEWPALKQELTAIFKTRTRAEWLARFAGKDACVSPVLTLSEAAEHPHNQARAMFIDVAGVQQNAPAPRFSRTVPSPPHPPSKTGADPLQVLREWGIEAH
jgi:alpha-methylacyl-CoA racemase